MHACGLIRSQTEGPSCIRAATDLRAGGFLGLVFASCVALVEQSIRSGTSAIAVDTGAVLVIGLGVIALLTLAVAGYHTYANRLRCENWSERVENESVALPQ